MQRLLCIDFAGRSEPHLNFEHPYFSLAGALIAKEKWSNKDSRESSCLEQARIVALCNTGVREKEFIVVLLISDVLLSYARADKLETARQA